MTKTHMDYRKIILNELEIRKRRNPSYNLSSLARLLEIPASRLSEILRGKVGISTLKAKQIAKILQFSPHDEDLFLDMVSAEHGRSPREREEAQKRLNSYYNDFTPIEREHFEAIADWYHHAIVELVKLEPNKSIKDISDTLAINEDITREALQRLVNLNLLEKNGDEYRPVSENRETSRDIPHEAIKKLNRQILAKASEELSMQDVSNRDYSIAFMSFNKSQMALAKERIREFRRSFMKEFESAPGKDSVYCTAIQFFELTGNEEVEDAF